MPTPAQWALERATEATLRRLTGLSAQQGFTPSPKPFWNQAEALATREGLLARQDYTEAQLGLFAEEYAVGGKRKFIVDTFAGFVRRHAPKFWMANDGVEQGAVAQGHADADSAPAHLYEVILQHRPCWLYFDLEYCRVSNPNLDPNTVMDAFVDTMAAFCGEVVGATLDESGMVVLDSSNPKKFSKHVLVKHLFRRSEADESKKIEWPLALENNAQAGLLVRELVAFATARRNIPGSPAQWLFVQAPQAQIAEASGGKEVTLIDESVYSRNRSFRLLFASKFGKSTALSLSRSAAKKAFGRSEFPPLRMLRTMVSFVPDDTPMFRHPLIPEGYQHELLQAQRLQLCPRGRDTPSIPRRNVSSEQHDALFRYLRETWDQVRTLNAEPAEASRSHWAPAVVQSCVMLDEGRVLAVTMSGNHFCFCKGASHKSNHIYLVVDVDGRCFRQKCHDIDCKHFASPSFPIPKWLLDSKEDEDFWDSLPDNLLDFLPKPGAMSHCKMASPEVASAAYAPSRIAPQHGDSRSEPY